MSEARLVIKDGKVSSVDKEAPKGGAELVIILDEAKKPKQFTVPNFEEGDPRRPAGHSLTPAVGSSGMHRSRAMTCSRRDELLPAALSRVSGRVDRLCAVGSNEMKTICLPDCSAAACLTRSSATLSTQDWLRCPRK
jgi:hypothetical protein